ncbi:DUF4265 domain-containing protein [Nocardia sp. NPDC058497]|uniref:DUF4265 domain-containing protein n=1 Tax=Nocardia sp. NPDC058497 TaxID=3346529 RepID=UPI003659F558
MSDDRCAYGHVRVFVELGPSGKPVHEELPAKILKNNDYEVLGSPVLTYGFAAGDRLRVADDGTFDVLERGGNLCIRVFPTARLTDAGINALTTRFEKLDGLVEIPPDLRFIVITVPVAVGFPAVEDAVREWAAGHDSDWEYGNVHDEQGKPLGWWAND